MYTIKYKDVNGTVRTRRYPSRNLRDFAAAQLIADGHTVVCGKTKQPQR